MSTSPHTPLTDADVDAFDGKPADLCAVCNARLQIARNLRRDNERDQRRAALTPAVDRRVNRGSGR